MSRTLLPAGHARHPATAVGQVELKTDGRLAGNVLVSREDDVLLMSFTVAHGPLPADTRRDLVEQAFQLPELNLARQQVLVTIPLGDVELLQGLQAHLCEVRAHAAGATCLVEATTR
jgi:hypothetical protein